MCKMSWLRNLPAAQRAAAWGAFLTLAGIMAGHAFLETARDALFLASLPAADLPWMYLGIAAGAILVAGLHRFTRRFHSHFVLSTMLFASATVTLGFWLFINRVGPEALYALYLWSGLYATTLVVQFWLVTSEAYTITQAKRVYGFVGAGGVVGAIAGAAIARLITVWFEPHQLLLAAFVTLTLSGLAPLIGLRCHDVEPQARPGAKRPRRGTALLGSIGRDPYLLRLALLVLISSVAITGVDYLFKSSVASSVDASELGAFFATVNIALNALALAAQLFLVPLVLRKVGVSKALAVLPVFLVAGTAGLAAGGGLLAAMLLIGAQGSLRHTLHRTGAELLYVPIAKHPRARAKAFIDGTGVRVGQAIGSLGILALVSASHSETILAVLVLGFSVLWIAVALSLQPHYLHIFRDNLSRGAIQTRVDLPPLDLESLEALIATLNSGEDAEVLAALELLRAEGKERLIPGLILYHPSTAVVLRALDIFEDGGRADALGIAERLHLHSDPEVRSAAMRLHSAAKPDESFLRAGLGDESPAVRATALVGLMVGGWMPREKAQGALEQLVREGPVEARLAIVNAVRRNCDAVGQRLLIALAKAPEREVRRRTAESMAEVADPRFLPSLLAMLAERDVRAAARTALVSMGREGLDFLTESMADLSLPHEVRRHIPRTVSRFRPSQAAPILLERLRDEPDGLIRFKILRGLGTMRADNPALRLDSTALREITARNIESAYQMIDWRLAFEAASDPTEARDTPGSELLVELLRDKARHAVERIFRLLGLQHPQEDFSRIYRGLQSKDARVQASAREILENTLPKQTRGAVLGLIDEIPDRERLAHASPFYSARQPLQSDDALRDLLDRGGESLQCLAAYHVGERGLTQLKPSLEELASSESELVTDVAQTALDLLDRRGKDRVRHATAV